MDKQEELREPPPKPKSYFPAMYFTLYPMLGAIAHRHGYALAVHGSIGRDFDLVAIPWTDEAAEPEALINAMEEGTAGLIQDVAKDTKKPHGRRAWNINLGCGAYLDVSVMPRALPPQGAPAALAIRDAAYTLCAQIRAEGGKGFRVHELAEALDKLIREEAAAPQPVPEGVTFEAEIRAVINRHSIDNACETPDYILAAYLLRCLENLRVTVAQRDVHQGRPNRNIAPQLCQKCNGVKLPMTGKAEEDWIKCDCKPQPPPDQEKKPNV